MPNTVPLHILFADDSGDDVALLRQAFEERSIPVVFEHALDGQVAAQTLAGDANFSLVLLDNHMPIRTGLEVLQQVRQAGQFPQCPVVILTSHILPSQADELSAAGAVAILDKPNDWPGYLDLVDQLVTLLRREQRAEAGS